MDGSRIRAGAGKAAVQIPKECFPMEKFTGIHDAQQVRTVLLEKEERIAVISIEITSLMADTVEEMKEIAARSGGPKKSNIWISVTHTFSAPHLPGGPALQSASEEELFKGGLYRKALYEALEASVRAASACMQEARLFFGRGECDVNVYRDIPSADGWWIGMDPQGPADKSLRVIGIRDMRGKLLALLYHYGVQSSVLDNVFDEKGGRLITGDLAGEASAFLEKALGDTLESDLSEEASEVSAEAFPGLPGERDEMPPKVLPAKMAGISAEVLPEAAAETPENETVALYLPAPCGDQAPRRRARYWTLDKNDHLTEIDLGLKQGFAMATELGGQLGEAVLKILNGGLTEMREPVFLTDTLTVVCLRQKKLFEGFPVPTKEFVSVPDGETETEVSFLQLAEDFLMIGVKPELNYVTAQEILRRFPYQNTLVVQMTTGLKSIWRIANRFGG